MQLRHRKWSVLILTSILLLGNMGLSQEAFAAKEKLEFIEISYDTVSSVDIVVTDKHGDVIITVVDYESEDPITITKSIFANNKFPSQLFFTASDTGNPEEIHTSGSQLLFITQLSGDCEIIDLLTTEGNTSLGGANKNKHKVLTGEGPPPQPLGKVGDLAIGTAFPFVFRILSHSFMQPSKVKSTARTIKS